MWFQCKLHADSWVVNFCVLYEKFCSQTKCRLRRAGSPRELLVNWALVVTKRNAQGKNAAHLFELIKFLQRTSLPDKQCSRASRRWLLHYSSGGRSLWSRAEARISEKSLLLQVQSLFFTGETPPPLASRLQPQTLLSVMGGIWPRALRNLIYLWLMLAIQAGDDSKSLVRFVLLLSPLPVLLSKLPIPELCLPSMCCGDWHCKLRGQGMSYGFSKNGQLHHLAQQVLALFLAWTNWVLPSCKNMANLKVQ